MSSILSVTTILPSTGTSIGIGTAGGNTTITGTGTFSSDASVATNMTLGGDIIHSGDDTKIRFPANDTITFETAGSERVRIASDGVVSIGTNNDEPAQLKVVYSTVPTFLTSTFDGTVGEATLSVNVPRTSDGSGSWGSHSNGGYGSAAIQALSHSSSGGYVSILTGSADNTNPTERLRISSEGHVLPGANNTYDLGSVAKGWRNVYMNDLNLSNMKGNTNDVDGTQGSWTIQEGKNDLYIINRLNGKKYKIKMEEVS